MDPSIQTTSLEGPNSIYLTDAQALICTPPILPWWFNELDQAVRCRTFNIPKQIFSFLTHEAISTQLDSIIPYGFISAAVREALKEDILMLVQRLGELTGAIKFRIRYMTSVPNRQYGFHVDTTGSCPTFSILRVYSGEGTHYVEPSNVTTLTDFYSYVYRREQAVNKLTELTKATNGEAYEHQYAKLVEFDNNPSFLRRPKEIYSVPSGSIVTIQHVPKHYLWPWHMISGRAHGWIHRSPFEGENRFSITITSCPP